jgi:hypothetical protein
VPYYNAKQFRASSDYDIRHRITFSGVFDMALERRLPSLPKRLTQGFSLRPIITYRTGFPLDVFAGLSRRRTRPGPSGAGDPNLVRANLVGNGVTLFNDPRVPQTFNSRTGNFYFNPGNFSRVGLGNFYGICDQSGVAHLRHVAPQRFQGPGRTNVDFAVAKTTPLVGERLGLELRAEFFNIFNHAEFLNPNTNIVSSTFGQITTTLSRALFSWRQSSSSRSLQ